ncbi:MAG: hypothetical protein OZ921_20825 [Sorangiineae bacterium]|nr:hypothetical protein [Polyangiaceae bacterium]MEB2324971.1 hypothetical protein [Sorangiineae bacterium]
MTATPALAPPLEPDANPAVVIHPTVGRDWPEDGLGPVERLAAELPAPGALEPGSWLAVDGGHRPRAGVLGRLLGSPRAEPRVHLAVRCTALLARGYELVCADASGVAYGRAPPPAVEPD